MRLRILVPLCLFILFAAITSEETDSLSMAAAVDRLEVAQVEYFLNTPDLLNVFRCDRTHRGFPNERKGDAAPVLIKRPPRLVNVFSSSHCLQLIVAPSCFFLSRRVFQSGSQLLLRPCASCPVFVFKGIRAESAGTLGRG